MKKMCLSAFDVNNSGDEDEEDVFDTVFGIG